MKLPEVREVVLNKIKIGGLSPETLEFLQDFSEFLLNTDYISEEAKLYLTHEYWTFQNIYNHPKYKDMSQSAVRYKLVHAITKINKAFGERMLLEVISFRKDCTPYREILEGLKQKNKPSEKFRKRFIIPLPEIPKEVEGDNILQGLTASDILGTVKSLKPYTKQEVDKFRASLDEKALIALLRVMDSEDERFKPLKNAVDKALN